MARYTNYPFTRLPDTDRLILLGVEKKSLRQACMVDDYARSLCDPVFWRRRFEQDYGKLDERNPPLALDYDYRRAFYHVYDGDYQRTLNHAIRDNDVPLALWAYKKRKEEEIKDDPELYNLTQDVLSWTIRSGDVNMARSLLKEIDVAKMADIGEYINIAAKNNNLPMIRYFIEERGVDYRPRGYELETFVENDAVDVVVYLIDRLGDRVDQGTLESLLLETMRYYIGSGMPPLVRYLVEEKKIDLNSERARLALRYVNNVDLLRYFVDHGADLTIDPEFIFSIAVTGNNLSIIRYLVEELGLTPPQILLSAASKRRNEIEVYIDEKFSPRFLSISQPSQSPKKQPPVASKTSSASSIASPRRCIALTLAGTQCKKMAIEGSDYCSIHSKGKK